MSAITSRDEARQSHLLREVTDNELARLIPNLHIVSLPLSQVIYESGERMEYVFFPTTAIISLLYIMENGANATRLSRRYDRLLG